MTWEDGRGWLWHLFNDPMNENPWSLVLLVVIAVAAMVALFTSIGWTAELRRRRMFGNRDSDRRLADEAIERARTEQPDEDAGQNPPAPRDSEREAADRAELRRVGDVPPAELHQTAGTPVAGRPATLADLTPPRGQVVTPVDLATESRDSWQEIGTTTGGGRVFVAPADTPDPVADSGVHALAETFQPERTGHFIECPHCQGQGAIMKTTSELLRESIALVGDGGDMVVKEFYTRLFAVAPDLAGLFPVDLLTAPRRPEAPSAGAAQRDKLLGALTALAQTYDPNVPEQMIRLDTALAAFGRSHAAFARADGSVKGATIEEYTAVKAVLFEVLSQAAGKAWIPEYTAAWSEAYDYAAGVMLAEAVRGGGRAPRFPRA